MPAYAKHVDHYAKKVLVRPAQFRALAPLHTGWVGSIAFVLAPGRLHIFHVSDIPEVL